MGGEAKGEPNRGSGSGPRRSRAKRKNGKETRPEVCAQGRAAAAAADRKPQDAQKQHAKCGAKEREGEFLVVQVSEGMRLRVLFFVSFFVVEF